MAISIGSNVAAAEVKVPHVWFFPKTRMERTLRKLGATIEASKTGSYTGYNVSMDSVEKGSYIREFLKLRQYYPRFKLDGHDEEVKQAIAPYAVVLEV